MTENLKTLQGSGLDDQTENQFFKIFKYTLSQLGCRFIRRSDLQKTQHFHPNQLHPETTYLITRGNPRRSEKLLSSLARGIWILSEDFVRNVIREERWIEPRQYDMGLNNGFNPEQNELHIAMYDRRKRLKEMGGIFKDEHVVILMDREYTPKYQRILKDGGAKVLSRTVQHLADRYVLIDILPGM